MYRMLICSFCPHIYNEVHHGFREAGCEVRVMPIGDEYESRTQLLIKHLIDEIEIFKPDLIFTYGWWKIGINIDEYLNTIKKKGIFHVWWSIDDPICFGEISRPVASKSDLAFTTVEELLPNYWEAGINAHLFVQGCPSHFKKVAPKEEYRHDIVLLANNYGQVSVETKDTKKTFNNFRLEGINNILKPLIDNNMDVMVWGRWWTSWDRAFIIPSKYYGHSLSASETAYVYGSSKIALGLQQVATSKTHLSVRTFEVLGCGAFHLSQYSQALEYYFKKGVHLEWSKSKEETLEIVQFYLKNENAREKIALKGQQEVHAKHTITHRAREALDIIRRYKG